MSTEFSPDLATNSAFALDRMHGAAAPSTAAARRAALFRETPLETARRIALGIAWSLRPKRLHLLPPLVRLWLRDLIDPEYDLPDANNDIDGAGLAGIVHDLSPQTVVEAYRRGLYNTGHFGPLKWKSPPRRSVLYLRDYHISKDVRRLLRSERYTATFDRDFEGVIKACSEKRDGKWQVTWITPRIMRLFTQLYDAGYMHSCEIWNRDGALVGGGYGFALGRIFTGESLFSREKHTSKLAHAVLNWHLAHWGFLLSDGKTSSPTTTAMGYREISRAEFLAHLRDGMAAGDRPGRWQAEADLKTIGNWNPAST